jgi:hypothetical protein
MAEPLQLEIEPVPQKSEKPLGRAVDRRCRRCWRPYHAHRHPVGNALGGFRRLMCPDTKGVYR